jgi:hypothetical protein
MVVVGLCCRFSLEVARFSYKWGAYDDVLDDLVIAQEPFLALSSVKKRGEEESADFVPNHFLRDLFRDVDSHVLDHI